MRKDDFSIFCEKFQPIMKKDNEVMRLYHWEGEDLKELQAVAPEYVWTMVDCDGKLYLTPGWRRVNRTDYVICKNPWNEKTRDYKYC